MFNIASCTISCLFIVIGFSEVLEVEDFSGRGNTPDIKVYRYSTRINGVTD